MNFRVGKRAIFLLMDAMDRTYQFLAAQYIRRQAKQLAEQFDGIRGAEDVEFIHRARVASRRLRAALKMFSDCFDAKKMKRWRKQIRGITEGLGEARDTRRADRISLRHSFRRDRQDLLFRHLAVVGATGNGARAVAAGGDQGDRSPGGQSCAG